MGTSYDAPDQFPTGTEGLPVATRPEVVDLVDGDTYELAIGAVCKQIEGSMVRMLAYSGSIPGPTLRVPEGAKVSIRATNRGDHETTVHWHGLRLDNRFDGTHETQAPIPIGGAFSYELTFPDPGVYWYHPHIREDYGQELGLYGNILVVPEDPDYWPPADRELLLTLDDVLIEDGTIATFSRSETTYVAMGRFGNVMLVSGEPDLSLTANRGEVVRLLLTNTANTRVFNVKLPGARMKLVGGDSGHYEREENVDEVLIAPSERAVVDVLFDQSGELALVHRTPDHEYRLAAITVSEEATESTSAQTFETLRTNSDMVAERERVAPQLGRAPDKKLAFVAEMDMGEPDGPVVYACPMHPEIVSDEPGACPTCGMKLLAIEAPAATTYICPMHPEIVSDEPGSWPTCGMKLLAIEAPAATTYICPMHPEVTSDAPDRCPQCGMKLVPTHLVSAAGHGHGGQEHHHDGEHDHESAQGIEWEDDMVEVNRLTTPANMRWKLVDRLTGAENGAIDWRFRVGDQVKIRLVNEMDSDHPMPHPFHIHGAGRFLILTRDDIIEPNLVWKDTVLIRTGETVDILLDVTNPGLWMAHCHIVEHHESGMMFSFRVDTLDP